MGREYGMNEQEIANAALREATALQRHAAFTVSQSDTGIP